MRGAADGSPLEDALDELYGVTPSEFTATRTALRDRLRDAGDADAAREIARVRRPTTAAWALNQLAREHADLVEAVLDRTADAAEIQAGSGPDRADDVRAAMAARRQALDAAVDAAVAIAAHITDNAEHHRASLLDAVEAGSLDEERAAALRAGRPVREAPTGSARPRPVAAPGRTERDEARTEREQSRTEREVAGAELERAEREALAAAERARERAEDAAEADARAAEAEQDLERARERLRVAKADARDARPAAQAAKRAATAAATAVDAARRRLEGLGD